jgi:hypothetical protein
MEFAPGKDFLPGTQGQQPYKKMVEVNFKDMEGCGFPHAYLTASAIATPQPTSTGGQVRTTIQLRFGTSAKHGTCSGNTRYTIIDPISHAMRESAKIVRPIVRVQDEQQPDHTRCFPCRRLDQHICD